MQRSGFSLQGHTCPSPMPAFARVKATKPLVIGVGCSYYKLQSDGTYWEAPDA